jgi:flagellar motor switch protein FliM
MTIDPIRDKLKAGAQFDMMAADPRWSYRLSEELLEAPLEISVEMGHSVISLKELLNLKPGDTVLMEDAKPGGDVQIKVGGVAKYLGMPGVRSGNRAVQVTGLIQRGG